MFDYIGFGKYPAADANPVSWVLGKVGAGEIRSETLEFMNSAASMRYHINSFQYNRVMLQAGNPGFFSLATNCTPFALDTARFIGINVPSNLTTYGIVNPAKVSRWLRGVSAAGSNL